MGRWVAAIVRDGAEQALAFALAESGIESYCPLHRRWRKLPKHIARKTGRTRELVTDALLTGYLFVLIEASKDLAETSASKDVFGFVKTSAGLCFARASDIEALREIERSGIHNANQSTKRPQGLAKGAAAPVSMARTAAPSAAATLAAMLARLGAMSLTDLNGKCVRLSSGPFAGVAGVVERVDDFGDVKMTLNGFGLTAALAQVELA